MFVAVYKFKARSGMEQQFERAWAERTIEIRNTMGSLGSRLHRADDGTYVGYAQWPSRQVWESSSGSAETPAMGAMREASEEIETILRLDVINDLLVLGSV